MKSKVALVWVVVVAGCGSVATNPLVAERSDALVPERADSVSAELGDVGLEVPVVAHPDGDALDAGADDRVDAVLADADGRDGITEIAETKPEARPVQTIAGRWTAVWQERGPCGFTVTSDAGGVVAGSYEITVEEGTTRGALAGSVSGDAVVLMFGAGRVDAWSSGDAMDGMLNSAGVKYPFHAERH